MNIDEAIEVAGLLAKRGDFWDLTSERQCAIILAAEVEQLREETERAEAEVKRLREFTEAQRKDNEQLRDRLKVLESQGQAPTAEESRGTFEANLAADGIGIGRYELMGRWDYCNYDARERYKGWQAAIEWVTKRQQES